MNRTGETGAHDAAAARQGRREIKRAFVMIALPFVLSAIGVVYLVYFSDFSGALRKVSSDERETAVRYGIEHTPPTAVPHLLAAVDRDTDAWDRRMVEAVVDLVTRTGWPPNPDGELNNAALVSRTPDA